MFGVHFASLYSTPKRIPFKQTTTHTHTHTPTPTHTHTHRVFLEADGRARSWGTRASGTARPALCQCRMPRCVLGGCPVFWVTTSHDRIRPKMVVYVGNSSATVAILAQALGSGLELSQVARHGTGDPQQMRVSLVMGHTLLHLRRVMVAGALPSGDGLLVNAMSKNIDASSAMFVLQLDDAVFAFRRIAFQDSSLGRAVERSDGAWVDVRGHEAHQGQMDA